MTRARRDKLILDNMPRVAKIARQVAREFAPHLDPSDFIQEGMLGLCQAARRCSRVSKFEAFSYFRIRGAMVDAHRRKAYREELNSSLDAIRILDDMRYEDPGRPDLEDLVERRQLEGFARDVIAGLPADERYVLGRALGGTKLSAIAESCGRSPTWTRGKLTTAREKVAAAVAELQWGRGSIGQ